MNVAVILAGGVGNRVGAGIPKQFIEVLGKPVLAYTLEQFESHPDIDAILVVCVKPYIDYIWELKQQYAISKLKWVTEGGDSFQGSVMNGLFYLEKKISRDDIVVVHFGASPFITDEIISDSIRVCKKHGNAISTTDYYLLSGKKKTNDSVSNPDNYTDEYINRDTIAVMNSPHTFQFGFVLDMYREAIETGIINTVEPHTTTLMYAMGKKIFFSAGSQNNIKITRKEDLELFEGYVLEKHRKSEEKTEGDVIVFLADGFEECEGLLVVDILRRAGLKVVMASIMGRRDVKSSRNIMIHADCLAENVEFEKARMVVLPGGRKGTDKLRNSMLVREQCKRFAQDRFVAAICAAPSLLAELGIVEGKRVTVHPDYEKWMKGACLTGERISVDGNIITCQGLGTSIPFALKLVGLLKDFYLAKRIEQEICFR